MAAHPHAAGPGGGELVPDSLADHLALELRERQQDVQRQPAHRGRGVERLGDGDEGHRVAVEHLDQLREIHQAAAEPVDLVDDHDVDPAVLDVGKQSLQRGPLQRAAGEAAVVVTVGNQQPAFRLLAGDVGLASLALGVEAVELLIQAFLARLPGVDRAAELAEDLGRCGRLLHRPAPERRTPKKTHPFHRVPVMARAIAESDLYGRPWYS